MFSPTRAQSENVSINYEHVYEGVKEERFSAFLLFGATKCNVQGGNRLYSLFLLQTELCHFSMLLRHSAGLWFVRASPNGGALDAIVVNVMSEEPWP